MKAARPAPVTNRLLAGLPRGEHGRIIGQCRPVDLTVGEILCEPEQRLAHVYFPLTACITRVAPMTGHAPLEMGLVGNEGMVEATLVLGVRAVPLRAIVQASGTALRMTTAGFVRHSGRSPVLLHRLKRYLYVLMAQLAQAAACARFHDVEARLARWLLLAHDRAHADHFHVTHQLLAGLLGVRRSGITTAAGDLQRRGLIRYARGRISVLDRAGLEAASCECYAAVVEDYAQRLA